MSERQGAIHPHGASGLARREIGMAITSRRRKLLWTLLGAGVVLVVVAALVFEPWKAFIDRRGGRGAAGRRTRRRSRIAR